MKKNILCGLALVGVSLSACSDFEDINVNPTAANVLQVKVEYAINQSITGAQQDPHIGERIFCLNWMPAARYSSANASSGISFGAYNIGWISDYYKYVSEWLTSAATAIELSNEKLKLDIPEVEKKKVLNYLQVARIWRAYLMSEFVDCFGAMPIEGFKGVNPHFDSCKDVYDFMLKELADAQAKLDLSVTVDDNVKSCDRAFNFDFAKWKRYANSMRMRLAMRLSEVDVQKAKSEFEAAAKLDFLDDNSKNLSVKERDGWDPLAGVMTRQWDDFPASATVNNLMIGLGGITTEEQFKDVEDDKRKEQIISHIKGDDYMGILYDKHFGLSTDDPAKGFWFDGLHNTIDPRAYALYSIPGDFSSKDYCFYPSWNGNAKLIVRDLLKDDKQTKEITLNSAFTWNAPAGGDWGEKGAKNKIYNWPYALPNLKLSFRNSQNSRLFFGSWESYFLIAEAAERGWSVPMSAKDAYEKAIKLNFEFFNLTGYVDKYINSEAYNNVGTSVKWDHVAEPPATKVMKAVNGYTNTEFTYTYHYPVAANTLYGKKLNDHLTKIITQKYLSNMPWLPLEAWNDQRRLGLPFFNTPMVEQTIVTVPSLNQSNYDRQSIKFYAQRLKFPSSLESSNPSGYKEALKALGGADDIFTPIWWAKH